MFSMKTTSPHILKSDARATSTESSASTCVSAPERPQRPMHTTTPTKYAGTKFHTTAPSPDSLPLPVFSQSPKRATPISTLHALLSQSTGPIQGHSQSQSQSPHRQADVVTTGSTTTTAKSTVSDDGDYHEYFLRPEPSRTSRLTRPRASQDGPNKTDVFKAQLVSPTTRKKHSSSTGQLRSKKTEVPMSVKARPTNEAQSGPKKAGSVKHGGPKMAVPALAVDAHSSDSVASERSTSSLLRAEQQPISIQPAKGKPQLLFAPEPDLAALSSSLKQLLNIPSS